jgi:putative peptidoglycan lipid II flippase
VAAYQVNIFLTQSLAFWTDPNLVAAFDYAVRLMELPQGVFGLSMATYLLPTLSGLATEKNYGAFRATLRQGLGYVTFTNALAAALLVALASPIVRLLFERGEFTPASTHRVAVALTCLAPGLLAFSAVNIGARAFFALGDTRTPMRISVVCLCLNLLFAFLLVGPYRQGGLGVANTLSAVFNAALLLYALRRKLGRLELGELQRVVWGLGSAAAVSGCLAWGLSQGWDGWLGHDTLFLKLGQVFVPAVCATLAYFGLTTFLKVAYAQDILRTIRDRLCRPGQAV